MPWISWHRGPKMNVSRTHKNHQRSNLVGSDHYGGASFFITDKVNSLPKIYLQTKISHFVRKMSKVTTFK